MIRTHSATRVRYVRIDLAKIQKMAADLRNETALATR
jgi:hypothetical protein